MDILSTTSRGDEVFDWTGHALFRWKERFSGINKELDFPSARRVGKKTKKQIKQLTPISSEKYLSEQFTGRYCLLSRSNVVYVVQAKENNHLIITVFHLYGD
jgi:hypothetical protein